jgi:hypothetical protein
MLDPWAGRLCDATASHGVRATKNWEGPIMDETTANPSGDTFRKFVFVLLVALLGFGVLELANVIHI